MNDKIAQLIKDCLTFMKGKSSATRDAYGRILRQLSDWMADFPGQDSDFRLHQLTRTAVLAYLGKPKSQGYSGSHQKRVEAVVGSFARWAIDQQQARGLT